ncbi:hypothetical protein [Singulisphaera sp. PoT]|uniref:hypothetical protein n=1 Tax=Singulisphaera sp. PoT TaxID=3411797 RepID=UPI003BF4C0C0
MNEQSMTTVEKKEFLTQAEAADLRRLEDVMDRTKKAWLDFGEAIAVVRDRRLYRATHSTFEAYCEDRWGISRMRAYQMIRAVSVVSDLEATANCTTGGVPAPMPTNEVQARPLSSLDAPRRREAWDKAVEIAGGSQPTEKQVREAVQQIKAPPPAIPARDEPADVARGREDGIIPIDAEVTIVEEEGEEPTAGEGSQGDRELTDAEWLETLPARANLSSEARQWFDAEAIAYRFATPHRRQYREVTRRAIVAAKRTGKHLGPWLTIHDRYLRQADPSRWAACKMCRGTGKMELVGKCAACKGHAYHVSGVDVVPGDE